jgi:hypothetical protein
MEKGHGVTVTLFVHGHKSRRPSGKAKLELEIVFQETKEVLEYRKRKSGFTLTHYRAAKDEYEAPSALDVSE